ncbi:MAG: NADH-quinone oxidoreductase subunit NuoK [Alphaproteobacteria bacterium]|nr:NADH-quinone oxidoreductase subunit NuoK [Alphaproteobacteria bacterium]
MIYPPTVSAAHYAILSALLFALAMAGLFLNRKNLIVMLMCVELMLLAVNLMFVGFSAQWQNLTGQLMAMFVLTVAAAEAAIGLAILVVYFRNRHTIAVDDLNSLQG